MIIGELELKYLMSDDGPFYAVYAVSSHLSRELVGTVARTPGTKTWEAVRCGGLHTSDGFKPVKQRSLYSVTSEGQNEKQAGQNLRA